MRMHFLCKQVNKNSNAEQQKVKKQRKLSKLSQVNDPCSVLPSESSLVINNEPEIEIKLKPTRNRKNESKSIGTKTGKKIRYNKKKSNEEELCTINKENISESNIQ